MTAATATVAHLRVGVQGETGCFSHAALRQLLGPRAEPHFFPSFAAAVAALAEGSADRLLLPVHNSLAGVVHESLTAIAAADLRVDGETDLPIRLVCAALPGTRLEEVEVLRSHPVALKQCTRFVAHHPRVRTEAVHDTAGAARLLAERGDAVSAVVTSSEAAEAFGLAVLARDIQDRVDNVTRFWLLARRQLGVESSSARMERHLAAHVTGTPGIVAVRGAISVDHNTTAAITQATGDLLATLLDANGLKPDDVVSAIFTLTPDLDAIFPANAARQLGWQRVPMLCATELAVPGALPRCLRVLLHVRATATDWSPSHIYLGEARLLRTDL
ncbi:MAG TPA: chorismate mutase [Gemmatimonadales bacterium]|nr:chorismate mutase [Gemmatimonadales bacterium]